MIATTEEQRLLEKWQKKLCEQDWSAHRECVAQSLCEKGA